LYGGLLFPEFEAWILDERQYEPGGISSGYLPRHRAVAYLLRRFMDEGESAAQQKTHDLPPTHSEVVGMTLLSELQPAIAKAIDNVGGKLPERVEDRFYFYASDHINTAVDAFIVLRREHRIDGARLLVRPALETMLRLQAVCAKPHLLYRVVFTETGEIDKWHGGVADRHHAPYTSVFDREEWGKFKALCVSEFGADKLEDTRLSAYEAAAAAGEQGYYDSYYRAYCQFTHGALEAVGGTYNKFIDTEDTRVMLRCALDALDVLVAIGADCPNIESFRARFLAIMKEAPDELARQ